MENIGKIKDWNPRNINVCGRRETLGRERITSLESSELGLALSFLRSSPWTVSSLCFYSLILQYFGATLLIEERDRL